MGVQADINLQAKTIEVREPKQTTVADFLRTAGWYNEE